MEPNSDADAQSKLDANVHASAEQASAQWHQGLPIVEGPFINTSGAGQLSVVPAQIEGWNWGAFFLNWIWGVGNSTYISFLTFVPFVNLVMPFVLGAKGNEWAWRNKRWESIEQFHSVQRGWAIAGIALNSLAIVLVLSVGLSLLIMIGSTLQSSQAYKIAVSRTQNSPAVQAVLGTPIKTEFGFSGSFDESETVGKVDYHFPVSGPKGRAEVHLAATKVNSVWTIKRLEVDPANGEPIDLTTPEERQKNALSEPPQDSGGSNIPLLKAPGKPDPSI